ncbi:MAG: hypothetical protein QOH05_455 [Acetobacteraceae bacterium]|jgi:hypothetical protein|nr:hypothetical protein [Acetobacteraceae bacterium]
MQLSAACPIAWTSGLGGSRAPDPPLFVPVRHARMMLDQLGDFVRLHRERLAQWLDPHRAIDEPPGRPLFFHHIAKTGGTSLVRGLRAVTPATSCLTERGNLSAGFVEALVARGLRSSQFIHGHPLTGAVLPVRGKARIVTMLREPRDQAISNYFWLRKDRRVPDHRAARQLGFREFLVSHPYFAIFQTASLHVAIEERPIARAEDLIDRLPAIFAYLEEMHAVAIPSMSDQLFRRLAGEMAIENPRPLPHRNETRLSAERRAELREQFAELQTHPDLAPLFAAERAVYQRARALAGDLR